MDPFGLFESLLQQGLGIRKVTQQQFELQEKQEDASRQKFDEALSNYLNNVYINENERDLTYELSTGAGKIPGKQSLEEVVRELFKKLFKLRGQTLTQKRSDLLSKLVKPPPKKKPKRKEITPLADKGFTCGPKLFCPLVNPCKNESTALYMYLRRHLGFPAPLVSGTWRGTCQWISGTNADTTPKIMTTQLEFDPSGTITGAGEQEGHSITIKGKWNGYHLRWEKTLTRHEGGTSYTNLYQGEYRDGFIEGSIRSSHSDSIGSFKITTDVPNEEKEKFVDIEGADPAAVSEWLHSFIGVVLEKGTTQDFLILIWLLLRDPTTEITLKSVKSQFPVFFGTSLLFPPESALSLEDEIPEKRRNLSRNLSDLGFGEDVCIKALEMTGDNVDRAAALMFENFDSIQAELLKDVDRSEQKIIEIQEIANKIDRYEKTEIPKEVRRQKPFSDLNLVWNAELQSEKISAGSLLGFIAGHLDALTVQKESEWKTLADARVEIVTDSQFLTFLVICRLTRYLLSGQFEISTSLRSYLLLVLLKLLGQNMTEMTPEDPAAFSAELSFLESVKPFGLTSFESISTQLDRHLKLLVNLSYTRQPPSDQLKHLAKLIVSDSSTLTSEITSGNSTTSATAAPQTETAETIVGNHILKYFTENFEILEELTEDVKSLFQTMLKCVEAYSMQNLSKCRQEKWKTKITVPTGFEPGGLMFKLFSLFDRYILASSVSDTQSKDGIEFSVEYLLATLRLVEKLLQQLIQDVNSDSALNILEFLQTTPIRQMLPLVSLTLTLGKSPSPSPALKSVITSRFDLDLLMHVAELTDGLLATIQSHVSRQPPEIPTANNEKIMWLSDVNDILAFTAGYIAICFIRSHEPDEPGHQKEKILDLPLIRKGLRGGSIFDDKVRGKWLEDLIDGTGQAGQLVQWIKDHVISKIFPTNHPSAKKADTMSNIVFGCILYCNGVISETMEYAKCLDSELFDRANNRPKSWLIKVWERIQSLLRDVMRRRTSIVNSGKTISYDELFDPIVNNAKFLMKFNPEYTGSGDVMRHSQNSWSDSDSTKDVIGTDVSKSILSFIQDESSNSEEIMQLLKFRDGRCEARTRGFKAFLRLLSNLKSRSAQITILTPLRWTFMVGWEEVLHHAYGLNAASRPARMQVQQTWEELYRLLVKMLKESENIDLKLAVLNAWNVKLEFEDLKFIADTKILSILQSLITQSESEYALFSSGANFLFSAQLKTLHQQENITKKLYNASLIVLELLVTQMALASSSAPSLTFDKSMFDILLSELKRSVLTFDQPKRAKTPTPDQTEGSDCQQLLTTKAHFKNSKRLTFTNVIAGTGTDFSVMFWINIATRSFAYVYNRHLTKKKYCTIVVNKDGGIGFAMSVDDKSFTLESKTQLQASEWHHVACVREGNTAKIYYDGLVDAEKQVDELFKVSLEGGPIRIGAIQDKNGLTGYLSDTRYLTRPLNTEEILILNSMGPAVERPDEYPYQLLSLLRSVASAATAKEILSDPTSVKLLVELFKVGTYRIKKLCMQLLKKLVIPMSKEAAAIQIHKVMFDHLALGTMGQLRKDAVERNMVSLMVQTVTLCRQMISASNIWKTQLNELIDQSLDAYCADPNPTTRGYALAAIYIVGGQESPEQQFVPSLMLSTVDSFVNCLYFAFSKPDPVAPELFDFHLQSSLLRALSIFCEDKESAVFATLSSHSEFKKLMDTLWNLAAQPIKANSASISDLEHSIYKVWKLYFDGNKWTEEIHTELEKEIPGLDELAELFPALPKKTIAKALKKNSLQFEGALNYIMKSQQKKQIPQFRDVVGDYPIKWLRQALEASSNDEKQAAIWFEANKQRLMDDVNDELEAEKGDKGHRYEDLFTQTESEKKSSKHSLASSSMSHQAITDELTHAEGMLRVLYARKLFLAFMVIASAPLKSQILSEMIDPATLVKLCRLLVFRTDEITIFGRSARDILATSFMEHASNEKFVDQLLDMATKQFIKIGAEDYKLEDLTQDVSSDRHALEFPNINLIGWILNAMILQKITDKSKHRLVYESLVYALKTPLVPIKHQIFHLLASLLAQLRDSDMDVYLRTLPITRVKRMAVKRLQKERVMGSSHVPTSYMSSLLSLLATVESLTENHKEMGLVADLIYDGRTSETTVTTTNTHASASTEHTGESDTSTSTPTFSTSKPLLPFLRLYVDWKGPTSIDFRWDEVLASASVALGLPTPNDQVFYCLQMRASFKGFEVLNLPDQPSTTPIGKDWQDIFIGKKSHYLVVGLTPATEYQFRLQLRRKLPVEESEAETETDTNSPAGADESTTDAPVPTEPPKEKPEGEQATPAADAVSTEAPKPTETEAPKPAHPEVAALLDAPRRSGSTGQAVTGRSSVVDSGKSTVKEKWSSRLTDKDKAKEALKNREKEKEREKREKEKTVVAVSSVLFESTDGGTETIKLSSNSKLKHPNMSLSHDQLRVTTNGEDGQWCMVVSDLTWSSGIHYWEITVEQGIIGSGGVYIGIANTDKIAVHRRTGFGISNDRTICDVRSGKMWIYGEHFGAGSTIGILANLEIGTLCFYLNGVSLGQAFNKKMDMVGRTWSPVVGIAKFGHTLKLKPPGIQICCPSAEFIQHQYADVIRFFLAIQNKTPLPLPLLDEAFADYKNHEKTTTFPCKIKAGLTIDVRDERVDPFFSGFCRGDRVTIQARSRGSAPRSSATPTAEPAPAGATTAAPAADGASTSATTTEPQLYTVMGVYGGSLWIQPDDSEESIPWDAANNTAHTLKIVEHIDVPKTPEKARRKPSEFRRFVVMATHPDWNLKFDQQLVKAVSVLGKKYRSPFNVPVEAILGRLAQVKGIPRETIGARVALYRTLNSKIRHMFSLVDFRSEHPGSSSFLIRKFRKLIFSQVKMEAFGTLMEAVRFPAALPEDELDYPQHMLKVKVNRQKASDPNSGEANTLFMQVHRYFGWAKQKGMDRLRQYFIGKLDEGQKRAFRIEFEGENVYDYGGPYREIFNEISRELHSDKLDIFIPTPNNEEGVGQDQGYWKTNPARSSASDLGLYEFIGALMAIALRTDVTMAFNLSASFWKFMVGEEPTRHDLKATNTRQMNFLQEMEESTLDIFETKFSKVRWVFIKSSKEVDLIPNGSNTCVTWERRLEYVNKVIEMQLKEDQLQHKAIRSGFGYILPEEYLAMFTAKELEIAICGDPEVLDIQQLKDNATYENVQPEDKHVTYFWRTLEELKPEEHAQFLRFAWARSRMPLSGNTRSLTIQGPPPNSYDNPDQFHPTTRTCFFSISLPRYTSYEAAKEKIMYAIKHCKEMDNDFRS